MIFSRFGYGPKRANRAQGLADILVGVVVVSVLLLGLLSAVATYVRGARDLRLRTAAEGALFSRAASLARMSLSRLPAPGVYGSGELQGPLAALLEPSDSLSFRLEVRSARDHAPKEREADGTVRSFTDFCRFRLSCHWVTGQSDLVLFRPRAPILDREVGGGQ